MATTAFRSDRRRGARIRVPSWEATPIPRASGRGLERSEADPSVWKPAGASEVIAWCLVCRRAVKYGTNWMMIEAADTGQRVWGSYAVHEPCSHK